MAMIVYSSLMVIKELIQIYSKVESKKEEEKIKKAQEKKTNNVHTVSTVSNVSHIAAVVIHNSLT